MMAKRDCYEILGIKKNATDKEIKSAYRKLAKKYHPDTNPGDKTAEERFKEVTESYEILSDPEKRKLYDSYGYAAFDGSMGDDPEKYARERSFRQRSNFSGGNGFREFRFEGGSMDDILKHMFSGGFGGDSGSFGFRESAPADYHSEINVSFREAALGCEKVIRFDDGGIGTLKVNIPAGISEGQSIRLAGKGEAGRNGKKGDLLLKVHVSPDSAYTREGRDVYITQNIPVWTAALGGDAEFDTLYGRVKCHVPAGSQSGKKIRLRGKGIVSMKNRNSYGDEYVVLNVQIPKNLTEREKELLKELQMIEEKKRRSSVA
ncbi:MAG: J domain-containing protein [Lachnospiraceae bacterium]|nr:J domain-containing protein [Lachnospiraceae bacterium]